MSSNPQKAILVEVYRLLFPPDDPPTIPPRGKAILDWAEMSVPYGGNGMDTRIQPTRQ